MPREKEPGPIAALLPEAIFNYVLTVEEYVFALSEGNMPENYKRARKSARNFANDFFFHSCVLLFLFFVRALSRKNMCKRAKTFSLSEMG